MKVDPKKLGDPFFELESFYNEYYVAFVSILRILAQDEANTFISKYCSLSCIVKQRPQLDSLTEGKLLPSSPPKKRP